jgi:hypothetical protein
LNDFCRNKQPWAFPMIRSGPKIFVSPNQTLACLADIRHRSATKLMWTASARLGAVSIHRRNVFSATVIFGRKMIARIAWNSGGWDEEWKI